MLAQLVGKFDDQDAVFGDQPHQGNEPDLAEHVQRAPTPLQSQQCPHHRKWHREQDDQRVHKALELSSQHQVDEQQGQHKHHHQRAGRVPKLARGATQISRVTGFEHPFGRVVHKSKCLAQRKLRGEVGGDGGAAALTEVVQLAWHHDFTGFHQC